MVTWQKSWENRSDYQVLTTLTPHVIGLAGLTIKPS